MPFDGPLPKPDVFSLDGLIAWLETQVSETRYDYMATGDCLMCRYLRAQGLPVRAVGGLYWRDRDGVKHFDGSEPFWSVASAGSFGAALERARALRDA